MLMAMQSFSKQDLPKDHRIVEPGSMSTMDHNPDRYDKPGPL